MSTSPVRIPIIVASYLSDEPFPQKVAKELSEHFSNVNESRKARNRGEPELACLCFRKEVISGAAIYRMTDEILINHVSVYFTLRDLNAARIACSRWCTLLSRNIVWHCQIPRFIPLCVMPLQAYLRDKTLGAYAQVKLIFLERRIACLNEAGASIPSVTTYRDLVRAVDDKKDLLAKDLLIFVRRGYADIVRIILQSPELNQDRGTALCEAAFNGHLATVQELLSGNTIISERDRGEAVRNASFNGSLKMLQELLKGDAIISQADRVVAARTAAKNGHLRFVQELLKDRAIISQQDRLLAARIAAKNGHLSVVQELLKDKPVISEPDRGLLVLAAVGGYLFSLVQELLKDGATISQDDREKAVRVAAINGHLEMIQELLKESAVISQEDRGRAIVNAAEYSHHVVGQELLKDGAVISKEHRGSAVCSAARRGHLAFVQELLNGGEISPEHREEAIQLTTNQDIINLLSQE